VHWNIKKRFVPVKNKCQFDGIYHEIHALSPTNIYIVMSETQYKQFLDVYDKLRERFQAFMIKETSQGTLKMQLTPWFQDAENTKDLRIIFDSSVPKDSYFRKEGLPHGGKLEEQPRM